MNAFYLFPILHLASTFPKWPVLYYLFKIHLLACVLTHSQVVLRNRLLYLCTSLGS